jgi:hypothetical protein
MSLKYWYLYLECAGETPLQTTLPYVMKDPAADTTVTMFAATIPVVVNAVGRANTRVNEMGFGRQLRNLQA